MTFSISVPESVPVAQLQDTYRLACDAGICMSLEVAGLLNGLRTLAEVPDRKHLVPMVQGLNVWLQGLGELLESQDVDMGERGKRVARAMQAMNRIFYPDRAAEEDDEDEQPSVG